MRAAKAAWVRPDFSRAWHTKICPGVVARPRPAFASNLAAYLQLLARQEDPDTLFFNRELEITGDTELGLLLKNMLDAVEWPMLPRLPLPPR